MGTDRVGEFEPASITQPHDQDGDEGLRDRPDAVLHVVPWRAGVLAERRAGIPGPHELAVTAQPGHHGWQAVLTLGALESLVQAGADVRVQPHGAPRLPVLMAANISF